MSQTIPCNSAPLKLLAITGYGHAVQKPHLDFLVRKPICPTLFVIAVVTLSNVCVH